MFLLNIPILAFVGWISIKTSSRILLFFLFFLFFDTNEDFFITKVSVQKPS